MTTAAGATSRRLRAAHLGRPHGVRGEVRVTPLGGDADRFEVGNIFTVEPGGQTVTVAGVREFGDGQVLLRFAEHPTRESVALLTNGYLTVDRSQARRLDDDEWFVADLVGLEVVTVEGRPLGTVADVESYVGNDVLVVTTEEGERRFPMVAEFVPTIDPDSGRIEVVEWEEVSDR